jgi:hypothetical protein
MHPPKVYSPECVEGVFCELRQYGVLRSTCIPGPMPIIPLGCIMAPQRVGLPGRGIGLITDVLDDCFYLALLLAAVHVIDVFQLSCI